MNTWESNLNKINFALLGLVTCLILTIWLLPSDKEQPLPRWQLSTEIYIIDSKLWLEATSTGKWRIHTDTAILTEGQVEGGLDEAKREALRNLYYMIPR